MKTCLVILNPGAEETETMTVADILVRAEIAVTVAGSEGTLVEGSRGLPMAASTTLDQVAGQSFDLVYLPGGMGSATYARDHDAVQDVLQKQLQSDGILAIICASPMALIPRGLGKDRVVTSFPAISEQLLPEVGQWVDQKVVWDGNLVTSQGPGTAMDLGFALVERLCGRDKAQEIAQAMLSDWTPA